MDFDLRSYGGEQRFEDLLRDQFVPGAPRKTPTEVQVHGAARVFDEEEFTFVRFHHRCNYLLEGVSQFVVGHVLLCFSHTLL